MIRHALKLYSNLVVAGIYRIPFGLVGKGDAQRLMRVKSYARAIAECVEKHPLLSAGMLGLGKGNGNRAGGGEGEVRYVRVDNVDVTRHFRVIRTEDAGDLGTGEKGEEEVVRRAMEQLHSDSTFMFDHVETVPAWSLDVLPLEPDNETESHRVLLAFTYSHSHGDGMSGVAFHRTLLGALPASFRDGHDNSQRMMIQPSTADLPIQIDAPENMPISLGFLLLPALCEYLPAFVTKLLGVTGDPVSGTDEGTWKGGVVAKDNSGPGGFVGTNVEVVTLDANTTISLLGVCRQKGVKLTALLNFVIAGSIRTALSQSNPNADSLAGKTNFVAQVPVNLRRGLSISNDTLGNFGGGAFLRHAFTDDGKGTGHDGVFSVDNASWQAIQTHGNHLGKSATNLRNQPLGLMRYVANFETWMQDKIGKEKGCSWELSNLGSFDTGVSSSTISIEQAFFSQPASPVGPPLNFNVISVKGGRLSVCISWETGALGVQRSDDGTPQEKEQTDRRFVQDVVAVLVNRLVALNQESTPVDSTSTI